MEYSSSEDDEVFDDCTDYEEYIVQSDVDQSTNVVDTPLHIMNHSASHLLPTENTIGNDLLTFDVDVKNEDIFLGMEFQSDSAARDFYNAYAQRLGFGIRVARSRSERRKGEEVLMMKRFVCLKEGHHKKKVIDHGGVKKKRKRLSIRDGCPAMMEVVRRGPERWVVTKIVLEHTHMVITPEKLQEMHLGNIGGREKEDDDSYLKEMRKKIFEDGDAQSLLEYFNKAQSLNPGFFYAIQVDCRNCMTNVFWADSRARMACSHFGDAVTFDTTYKKNGNMAHFAAFTGMNQHGQPVVFGCALIMDETESSYSWLFETWVAAMFGRHPISLTTDQGKAIAAAVSKVFPNTQHRLCKWRILSRCKKKLRGVHSEIPVFYEELKQSVLESETDSIFVMSWESIIGKYNLRENPWMRSLYNARFKWVPAFLKESFSAEMSPNARPETLNKFFRKNFDRRVPLLEFLARFDQAMDDHFEKEIQGDMDTQRILKTDLPLEKHACSIYTRAVFERFQMELGEALNYYGVKIQDGPPITKYSIARNGDAHDFHVVSYYEPEKKAVCSCHKFETSGIMCRHLLTLLWLTGIDAIPDQYILKRWTRRAKGGLATEECGVEAQSYCQHSRILRYNDLFRDAVRCAEKGAASTEAFRAAKDSLRKAFADLLDSGEGGSRLRGNEAETAI